MKNRSLLLLPFLLAACSPAPAADAPSASEDAAPGAGGFWRIGGSLQVKVEGGAAPVSSHGQLLVPVTFDQGQARLQISYRWL
jgi:hypothetical protein